MWSTCVMNSTFVQYQSQTPRRRPKRSAFSVQRSAFSVRRSAFRRLHLSPLTPTPHLSPHPALNCLEDYHYPVERLTDDLAVQILPSGSPAGFYAPGGRSEPD